MRISLIPFDLNWTRRLWFSSDYPAFLAELGFRGKAAAAMMAQAMLEAQEEFKLA